ncbi:uncharacterized protein HMPREF1541_11018 [Cyphellophora europaea CBS 101466]|uniref:Uncharacterized protein n=1 Tax=Cyphellophora europaea (strain CBS 101466) TaxID=1220924 RepID=W2S5E4_CYPE1|nr:uncharacterized protein HMPREF1541_11018 [Cyphellophora europaea CBS 101466]ETN43887.1 hypothetical protein HMPREF1541_11018 [Cyphellophora europaea CBS 101466]
MGFKLLTPPLKERPRARVRSSSKWADFLVVLRGNFSLTTLLLFGAVAQTLILLIVPYWWALIFSASILLYRGGHTLLITLKLLPNPYLAGSHAEWASAQLPNKDGVFSSTPASEQVAVLHLGSKYNHPLGIFAPHAAALNDHASNMYRALDAASKAHSGYLGGQGWLSYDDQGAAEYTFVSYWRSIDAIHAFAYSPSHRAGWEWWNSVPKDDIRHLGINHEIFLARPGEWETIYLNHQPTMLAGTHSWVRGDKEMGGQVEDSWVTNVVEAKGRLRTSAGRLGWQKEALSEKHRYVPLAAAGEADDGRDVRRT